MEPIDFPRSNIVFGRGQPQYRELPAHLDRDGIATFCWKLTWRERWKLMLSGKLWHCVMLGGGQLQPQMLSLVYPLKKVEET